MQTPSIMSIDNRHVRNHGNCKIPIPNGAVKEINSITCQWLSTSDDIPPFKQGSPLVSRINELTITLVPCDATLSDAKFVTPVVNGSDS